MDFILLLVLLGSFGWLAVWADRRIQAHKQARLEAAATPPAAATKTDQGWRALWQRRQPKDDGQAFRTWAAVTFANQPPLQQWLAALPDDAIQPLNAKLADFCTDLGFTFAWLLEHKVDQDATLAPRLQTIVIYYIEACYQAYLLQEDVKAFQIWQDFTQHPYRQDQQVLAQRLLAQLIEQGLTPTAARSLLTASEKEHAVYVVQAVREAAEKYPDAFRAVLKALVTANHDLTPTPEMIIDRLKRTWLRRPVQEGQSDPTAMSS